MGQKEKQYQEEQKDGYADSQNPGDKQYQKEDEKSGNAPAQDPNKK